MFSVMCARVVLLKKVNSFTYLLFNYFSILFTHHFSGSGKAIGCGMRDI